MKIKYAVTNRKLMNLKYMLEIINLSKNYGYHTVLQLPHQSFNDGVTWIKGKNGSGKSTLLKILAGLIDFDGAVAYNRTISLKKDTCAYRRVVNFAESEPLFPSFFTGYDMIKLFVKAKNGSQEEISTFIDGFDMHNYMGYEVASYSAGMLKKLSLVLAFIGKPGLILLDEPFITLDEEAINQLAGWIKRDTEEKGTNFIITSHQNIPSVVPIHNTYLLQDKKLTLEIAD